MCDVLHYITMRERPSAIPPAENGDGDRLRAVLDQRDDAVRVLGAGDCDCVAGAGMVD